MKHKYIMFDCDGIEIPVVFSVYMTHKTTVEALMPQLRSMFTTIKVVSAGFYDFATNKCYGDSESLKLKSNPDDARFISGILGANPNA